MKKYSELDSFGKWIIKGFGIAVGIGVLITVGLMIFKG